MCSALKSWLAGQAGVSENRGEWNVGMQHSVVSELQCSANHPKLGTQGKPLPNNSSNHAEDDEDHHQSSSIIVKERLQCMFWWTSNDEWPCDQFDQTPVQHMSHDSSNEEDEVAIWWGFPWWSRPRKYFGKSIRIHEDWANVIECRINWIGSSFCRKQGFQVWKGRT